MVKQDWKDFQILRKLDKDSLRVLASDIRADILSACLFNGGHLSSNLGVVELTLSLLKNLPPDANDILFDVGHQAYTYKIMTGRDIHYIRRTDGVSPFNLREESPYDVYSNGHAGDCLSTGIGIAKAKMLKGDDSYTICVIGDASMENGISYEALDFLASKNDLKRLIIVLNDNGMAISKNNGPLSRKFADLRNSRFYFRTSSLLGRTMSKHKISWKVFLRMRAMKDHFKGMVLSQTIFESMGLKYIGPYDGHDFDSLDLGFEKAKVLSQKQPVILHLLTKKGYGYPQAMKDDQGDFHGVGRNFDSIKVEKGYDFTTLKKSILLSEMEKDGKMVILTPAMEKGSGLQNLFEKYPDRCVDTGISEEHSVVMASGLAIEGYHPILDIYSTFLQRTYDEIIENVSRNSISLPILVERAGLVGEDGSSHHGIYDVAMVSSIPYRRVTMPFDQQSLEYLAEESKKNEKGPFFIRFPKTSPCTNVKNYNIIDGVAYFERNHHSKLVIGISSLGYNLISALPSGYDKVILLDLLMEDSLLDEMCLTQYEEIYLYDPYSIYEGSSLHMESYLLRKCFKGKFHAYAFDRKFIPFGQMMDLLEREGMDVETILKKITKGE
jgi:1-deoxy-D-xylulose-5-phosphate synthase